MAELQSIPAISQEELETSSSLAPIPAISAEEQGTALGLAAIPAISDADYQGISAHPAETIRGYEGGTFRRGIERGVKQSAGLYGQLIRAIGDETGFAGMIDVGDDLIRSAFIEALANPAQIQDLGEIDSLSKASTFFWQTLGEQIPNLAIAAAGAVTGTGIAGYATRAAVTRATLNNIAQRAAAKGLDPIKMGTRFFKHRKPPISGTALKVGAAGGTFGAFLPINTGEILQEQRDAYEEQQKWIESRKAAGLPVHEEQMGLTMKAPELGPSLALGAASSALEILGFGIAGQAIFGKAKKEVVEHMVKTVLRRVGHASLKSLAGEGGTEAVQEVLVIASRKINDPTFSITDAITSSEGLSRIAFAGVSGAVVGAAIGGGGGVATGVRDAGLVGLRRADLRGTVNTAKDAVSNTFKPNESGEVESLFDLEIARKQMVGMVGTVRAAVGTALGAIKNNLAPQDQTAAIAAAQARQGEVATDLINEGEILKGVDAVLDRNEAVTATAIEKVKGTLEQLQTPASGQERSAAQHKAVKKARDEIKALLDEAKKAKKANVEGRAAKAAEMLALAEKLTSRAMTDPLSVPVDRIRVLTNAAERYAKAGYKKTRQDLKKAANVVRVMQNQVSNATKDLPSADMSIMDEGTTTSPGEVLRAVEAVAEGRKTHAFAVGATLASLSDEVKAAIAKAKLRVRYDGKQVIIANKENINKDAVAESFATPVEEIADDGLVVTARDAAGGVIQNEAVPSDPAAIAEAVGRGEQVGATSEVRSPNQAITESVQEVVEEAEALQLSLTFGEVEDVLRHESQLYARVAARNKKTGKLKASNRLIEVVLSDEGVLSRDDSAKPFALFDNEEQIEAAKKLKTSQKKFAGIAPLNKKGEAQVDQIEFDTVEINGQLLLRAKLPGDTSQAIEQQIRKVIRRGNNTPNKAKFTVEATRDGSEVHLHLGEVTRLGMLNSEGSTGKYEMAVSTQAKFLDGLYTLMLRGYKIDFDAARDGNKVIYGSRLRYKDGPWLSKVLNNSASDEQIDLFNAGEISAADIAPVLWGQGAALSEKEIIEILEEASAITEAVGTDPSEVHVVETKRKENQHNAGLSGTVADRLNAVAFPRGREGDVARREGRTSIMDEPVLNPVFDNARGFILNTASKPTDQVQNYLVGWPAAQSAAEYTLKMLNIKEQLVLFDEHSAAGVLSMYNLRARLAVDETQRATYQMYSQAIEKVLKDDTAGRIITPPSNAVGEDRVVHIFVAKNRPRVTASGDSFSRGLVLMHEIGHLVQYTHLDRLSPKLKALVLDSLGPENATETQKRDAFANWMAKVATDIHFGRKVRAETEVDNIFVRIVEDLKRIWKALRGDLGYKPNFIDFVEALNAHARSQRGEAPGRFATPLGRAMYQELQKADAGAFIPSSVASGQALDMSIERPKWISRADVKANLDKIFVFGDNDRRTGLGGQAKSMRGEPNTIGVRTKKAPNNSPNAFYKDEEFGTNKQKIDEDFQKVLHAVEKGRTVVIPADGLGTGRARLGPRTSAYINEWISKIETTASLFSEDMNIDATVEETVERAQDSVFGNYVDNFQQWASTLKDNPLKAGKMLIYTADSELRGMGPIGIWLAKQFHALPSSTDPSLTVFREIMMRGAQHFTALNRVLNTVPGARISLWESVFNKNPSAETLAKRELRNRINKALLLQTPLNEVPTDIRPHVKRLREYLEGLYGWYTDSMGMPLKHREHYFPLMFDTAFLEKHRGEFIAILRRHNFSESDAQNIRMKITRDEDGGLTNGFHEDVTTTEEEFFGPGLSANLQRADWTLAMRKELVEAGFYQKDIATTLIAYTEMLTRRAVWARRFKDEDPSARLDRYDAAGINPHGPVAKLQLRLYTARQNGLLNEWQYQRIIRDILPAYAGQLGLKTNAKIRKLSAGIVIYQNIRLLAFAIFAQFVDIGTLMSRGEFKDTQAAMKILMSKTDRDQAMVMLEAIGAYRQGLTEHVLNDQALNTFMTGNAKRINDLFFRYNGMEGWTNLMRAMGLIAGREFIQRNARKAQEGDAKAQRYMNELSLGTPELLGRVIEWDGTSTTDEQINAALNRFIDEAMIRPDPTIRPVWMSDPGYGIFAHLKGFLYGFHETFLRRVGREAKIHQNLLPLLTLGMLALPFAAIGYELRRKILGSKESPEGMNYMKELVERAGLFGAWQLVVDMEQADEYGKPFALGIGGPAVEQLFDFFDRDFAGWLPRATPIVSSSPPLRDWLRSTISEE